MEDFGIFESGFNNADETINFGSRSTGQDSLYEISTKACLKCSGDNCNGVEKVVINTLVKNERVFLSINNSIKIFENKSLTTIIFNAVFDSVIDSICVSPNGKFLLICLKSGVIHIFDLENSTENNCLFRKCLINNEWSDTSYIGSFIEYFTRQFVSFILVSSRGKIFRVFINLKANLDNNSPNLNINVEDVYDFGNVIKMSSFSYPILFVNGIQMNVLNVENNMVISDTIYNLKTICCLGHKFLGLDEEGNLLRICSSTLVIFPVTNVEILFEEILVMDDNDGNKKIVMVTKKNEQGESFLNLSNPDFSPIFSLKISNPVHIVQLENANDEILFLSKISNNGYISELRVQEVCETEPELKLMRLIRKHRFEEAEKFANTFNIDPTIVLKARAQVFVDKTVCTSDDIVDLIKLLESIDDEYFKLQCCSNVECINHEDVRKILNYGSKIMLKSNCENKEAVLLLQRVLMDLLFKFDTYMALYSKYDPQTWSKFSSCDLMEELKMHLKNFQIEESIIICNRLDSLTIDKLTDEKIEEIVLILNNLPTTIYQLFLPTFIPITMMHRPSALSIFVKWLNNKIFQLEKRDAANFPSNGIIFAESILKLLKVDDSGYIFFQRQCTLNKESLSDLSVLIKALKSLQLLKKDFKITMPLSKYLMDSKTVIRALLNIVMAPEDYEYFIQKFLYKFIIQNQFEPDEIFLDEIKNLIGYDEEYWVEIVEIILKYICSVKIKLEAIKEILENARVPWCDTIRGIGQSAFQYSLPLVLEIKNIYEDEPRLVVLRNPKYKIKEKQITNISELRYVVNKIVYINEPSLINDVYQLCKTTSDRHEVNIILIQHFIKIGNFENAMAILDNNSKEEIYMCAQWFISYAEIAINNRSGLMKQRDNYYNVLRLLYKRLLENSENIIYNKYFEDDLHILQGIYNINKIFGKKYIANDLRSTIRKKEIINELLEEVADNFAKGPQPNIGNALGICNKLAFFFSLDNDKVLIRFCEKLGKFEVILRVAEHLYKKESSSKNLCLIAILLLKYMASFDIQLTSDSFSESSEGLLIPTTVSKDELSAGNSSFNFIIGLKLSEKITKKAFVNVSVDDLSAVVEVMNWINNGFYLTRCQENSLQMELFRDIYHTERGLPGYSTFVAIRNIFEVYCAFIEKFQNPNTKYLTYFTRSASSLSEEELLQEIQLLPDTIDSLCSEGQHLTAYKLIITLENGLRYANTLDSGIIKLLNSIIAKKCIPQLLHVVISAKHIDEFLFQNLLLASHKNYIKYIEHYLKLYRRQPKKLRDIASVGIKLLDFHKVTSGKDVLVITVITCKWWNKLKLSTNSKIQYDSFFKVTTDVRLKQLISLDLVDVKLIKEYCEDYHLDLQVYYMDYLKSILVNWKPDYECKKNFYGKKNLLVKNDENSLLIKCQEIIDCIKDKEAAFAMMNKIWDMVNFYHYEVFICILNIVSNNSNVERSGDLDLSILLFLKNYHRFSSPSQSEEEQWYGTFPDSQNLDPLSEFRLPFVKILYTPDIWAIIRPEINLKSYKKWFDATNILQKNLKKDTICIYAIKEVVSSKILEDTSGNWVLYPKFEDLFAEVDECVQNISDLEQATSVVYHLMYHTPNGADKVKAAELSYKYAQKYKEQNPNSADVDKAFIKVRIKYYSFSAMHILHTFQLAAEKYLQLVAQPEDLINALYRDERILKQAESIDLSCPDINKAVNELGKLFDLNIIQIKYNLLNQWLVGTSQDVDFDSTALFSTNITNIKVSSNDNLKRATYICSSDNKPFWQKYLLKVGINEDDVENSERRNFSFKAKALKCFCAISDIDTIINLTELTYKEVLNYIDKLSLLSEMECLGIALNVDTLDQYNKKELLKRLSQVGKPGAVKVMASICITYVIEDIRYWEFIINSTIKLGMFAELKTYVDFLKHKCYKNFYINAWQIIVENAFQLPNTVSQEELHNAYINNFLMIQSCPVLYSLNFEKIVQKCIKVQKFEFAAVLLQFLPEEQKEIYVNSIVQNRTIFLDLDNLSTHGIWGIRNVKSWLGTRQK